MTCSEGISPIEEIVSDRAKGEITPRAKGEITPKAKGEITLGVDVNTQSSETVSRGASHL